MPLDHMLASDPFMASAARAFLVPVALSAACYLVVSVIARLGSPIPRAFYIRRLILMFLVLVAWWFLFLPSTASAFIGNNADPHNAERRTMWMAKQIGTAYGMHAIWAWCLAAIVVFPRARPNEPR